LKERCENSDIDGDVNFRMGRKKSKKKNNQMKNSAPSTGHKAHAWRVPEVR
jgi:hypothetical protein